MTKGLSEWVQSHSFKEFLELLEDDLPDGVHRLSQESQDIMQRIAERSAALEAGFVKRGS